MATVDQKGQKTQQRMVRLFREQLGYAYLGDWSDREGNRNIEEDLFRKFLREKQGYDETLITRALHLLTDRSIHASVAAVSGRTESVALRSCDVGVLRKLHEAG
jgi:hypothetical protein